MIDDCWTRREVSAITVPRAERRSVHSTMVIPSAVPKLAKMSAQVQMANGMRQGLGSTCGTATGQMGHACGFEARSRAYPQASQREESLHSDGRDGAECHGKSIRAFQQRDGIVAAVLVLPVVDDALHNSDQLNSVLSLHKGRRTIKLATAVATSDRTAITTAVLTGSRSPLALRQ